MLILDHLTLDGLSLEIADGQLHGFVGPNGAGKTTTMRILATLLKPTSGTASVDGADVVKDAAEARRRIGYMPDFFGVYDSLKCWEYLDFYGRCYRQGQKERKQMTDRLLDLVQLTDKREAFVDSLSRGMKQRLCLARSLIHDPSLLILDEPASGMDPRARADMKTILRTLREMGKLDHGKLVFSGSVEALSEKMNGSAPLEIRLREGSGADAAEQAVACLKELPFVKEIIQDGTCVFRIRMDAEQNGEQLEQEAQQVIILQQLMARGVPVCDFHRAPMNLEKVFMEVTENA